MTIWIKKNKKQVILRGSSIIFLSLFLLFGCRTIKYVPIVQRHDSIVEKTVRDTVLKYLPQKQSAIAVNKSHLETDLAISNASIDSLGLLHHSIENKGTIPGKVISDKTTVHDSIPVPYKVEVPGKPEKVKVIVYVHGFIWWVGLIVLISGGLFGLYKLLTKTPVISIIKKFLKPI